MKDQIFIVWSGSNEIALRVKRILETKNYKCTIGGNSDNDSRFASVGDTVIQQIKTCNQAIVIFQIKENGQVSTNLFFELGYVLASYGQTKVHCVKRSTEEVSLPSDFDNSFVEPVKCSNDEQFVEGIIRYFFDRQKMSVNTNKMMLINNRYRMHDYIQSHFSEQGSKCSDYELAQYILFYLQAAHMFGDEAKVRREMKHFKEQYSTYFSDELAVAVNICITFFDMVLNIKLREDSEFYIDRTTFRNFRDKYREYRDEVVDDDMGTFDEWANVFLSEHLAYAYSLYAMCPDLNEEGKKKNFELGKLMALRTIKDIEVLEAAAPIRDNNDHKGILSLFYAYVYRNLFLCEKELGNKKEMLGWLEKTRKERTSLRNNFEAGSIDTQLFENFEMEYYLCLIESLTYAEDLELDEDDIEDYKDEIARFVEESTRRNDYSRYVERSSGLLKKL